MDQPLNQRVEHATHPVIDIRRVFAATRSWARAHLAELACAALLAAMSLQMFAVISRKSITVDEIVMIPSAYYHLAAGNFQLVNEHPPLAKIIAGVPALFVQPNEVKAEQIVGEPGSLTKNGRTRKGFGRIIRTSSNHFRTGQGSRRSSSQFFWDS